MKSLRALSLGFLTFVASFSAATTAFAHPELVSTNPANKASVSAPANITLSFSETLLPKLSGAELTMTKMPGMTMPPMKIAVMPMSAPNAKSIVIMPSKPLGPGSYRVDWHVVSADTHSVKGSFEFEVK
ncbi:copper homeostasis periplasmic binding protein CopC [Stenotrophomonas riyadhensis]|uniref:copper homeostasis periplasmic binding protein CopC n=1 Tax=Stenotrophomonas riyadhensis TaxID=2859893 RepID=UPI0021FC129A|nr:copper homeostasis periplasmic binding protein CopC [Stenotrophomonas sp. CD2]HEL3255595.1 copper homeostasis periplasmic binding protein CopC [Stenotrophomonas maltophilia]HEL5042750.1 copper homeostasis periplasmic binding protein CopC [Stenotrophomonas maltophilia]